jgi:hypothetical protein
VIRVSVEVHRGVTCFTASVCAESIEQALNVVRARFPGAEATVAFPIDPEAFFVRERALVAGIGLLETRGLEIG